MIQNGDPSRLADDDLIEALRAIASRWFNGREQELIEEAFFRIKNRAKIIENYPSDRITD
jgi:hypothetical protein